MRNSIERSFGVAAISLTQLRHFIAAAEHSSMTQAGSSLAIAQSAVSTSVANLERSIGTELFFRQRAKGLQLTAAGIEFRSRAQAILDGLDDAVDAISPHRIAGRLQAACFYTIAPFYLPAILDDLHRRHADLVVELRELSAAEVNDALLSRTIEIALTYDLGLGAQIEREVLATVAPYAAVARGHRLAGRSSVTLRELATEPMVLLDVAFSRDYFTGMFDERGLQLQVGHRLQSFEAVRAMVARGHGFTVLNQQPSHDRTYDGGRLVTLPITDKVEGLAVVLASVATPNGLSRRAQAFANSCRELFS
jgi:DNA-binding transcriptional LysR family regulator